MVSIHWEAYSCDPVSPTGTRNAVLNTEARTVDADVLSRRCVLMRLLDFSYEHYQKALRQSAGAVVIILPRAMAAVPQDVVRVSLYHYPTLAPQAVSGVCLCLSASEEGFLSLRTLGCVLCCSGQGLKWGSHSRGGHGLLIVYTPHSNSWRLSPRCWPWRPWSPCILPWRMRPCCPSMSRPRLPLPLRALPLLLKVSQATRGCDVSPWWLGLSWASVFAVSTPAGPK